MIDTVAFDLDDTLWLESRAQERAVETLHREWAVEHPFDAFWSFWREVSGRLFDAYTAGQLSHGEQRSGRIRELRKAFGQAAEESDVEHWTRRYVELYQSAWKPVPDAIPVLERLKDMGVGLAVVTNGDGGMQRAKLSRMDLLPRFDWVVISGEVGAAKPDPVIFEHLLAVSGREPGRFLFVGDRRDKDVDPARRMGMAALQIDHEGRRRGDDVIHSLPAVVERIAQERQAAQDQGA